MLEHVPRWLGQLLRNVRAGHAKLVIVDPDLGIENTSLDLGSPAFANGGRLPIRFTADGEGTSPPLVWGNVPEGTAGFALIVEDPDAPVPSPIVHALAWALPAEERSLAEGALSSGGGGIAEEWLPPDPPTGHGTHDYVFQIFALSQVPDIGRSPGRSAVVKAIDGNILAAGMLVGTYSRGEEAMAGPSTRAVRGAAA